MPDSPVIVKDADVPVVEPVGRPLTAGAVVGAVASTVQATVAFGPTLPAASVRCTRTACPPSASPVSASGDVQAAKAAPSMEQAYVSPAPAPVSVSDAVVWVVGSVGRPPITGVPLGATVSISQTRLVVGPPLPAVSAVRTSNVWLPSVSPVSCHGVVQVVQAPPSMRHW